VHPILFDSRKLISYVGSWLLIGLLIARLLTLADMATWTTALQFSLPVSLIYGFVASSAHYVCRSLPITGRRIVPTFAVFATASLVCGGIWIELCMAWNSLAATMGWWSISFSRISTSLLFSAGCGCYLISLLVHDVLMAADRVRTAELDAARLLVQAREAELQMLRAQINPHFLFNSLNSISALTSMDAAAARSMTIALAQFFRQSLTLSGQTTIALNQELALCEAFLAVESNRFGSKLQHVFEFDVASLDALIPPMLLQPLIENAIKHGIRELPDGGVIYLSGQVRDDWLHIQVDNPYEPTQQSANGGGIGLPNIRQRLANLYGNQARFQWKQDSAIFSVEITLPFVKQPDGQP
jgi:two-component system sensor histidine kinase AlgZ